MEISRCVKCTDYELPYLDKVMGQLSDGMWENSPRMIPYWKHSRITTRGIAIDVGSPFNLMSDEQVREWFASKLKAVVKEFIKNHGGTWSRTDNTECIYLDRGMTIASAYKAYDSLMGRSDKTGKIEKTKLHIPTTQIQDGDIIGAKEVVKMYQPLTPKDMFVTIVYKDDTVERISKYHYAHVIRKKIIQ